MISAFVFTTWMMQFLFCLYPKFQASSLLLWLYRLVYIRPSRKHKLLVFTCEGSNWILTLPFDSLLSHTNMQLVISLFLIVQFIWEQELTVQEVSVTSDGKRWAKVTLLVSTENFTVYKVFPLVGNVKVHQWCGGLLNCVLGVILFNINPK